MPSRPKSANHHFVHHGNLVGHHGSVICIRSTEDGRLAASGGADGTRLWNLDMMASLHCPAKKGLRGSTTAVLWARREDEAAEILFYGTEHGFIVCWKQTTTASFEEVYARQLKGKVEVSALCFDAATNRLVVVDRNGKVLAFAIERDLGLRLMFSEVLVDAVPKAVAFGDIKDGEKEILLFGLYDGQLRRLHGSSGAELSKRELGGMIGDASVNISKGLFCIDDPHQGVAIYRINDLRRLKTLGIKTKKALPRARNVCFADDAKLVVSGSDHGVGYIFDRWSEQVVDELYFGVNDWLQTIAAVDTNGTTMILGARSRDVEGQNDIVVWRSAKARIPFKIPSYFIHVFNFLLAAVALYYVNPYLPKNFQI
ncbi:WD40 repeat-like protein [Favolaschia claudopus]|uniref:WD40 repeat-like protein n=1 Tax=Favolaschia claudopus TaxID=2862362 RepID=A0AAW0E5Y2_9AGAR